MYTSVTLVYIYKCVAPCVSETGCMLRVSGGWGEGGGGGEQVSSMIANAKSFAVDTDLIIVVSRIQGDLHGNRQHGHVGFYNWACQIVKTRDR